MIARAARALTCLFVLTLAGLLAGCAGADSSPALEPLVEDQVWRIARDGDGPGMAGFFLRTDAGLVGLDIRSGDPTPESAVPVLLLDSIAPQDDPFRAPPDTPRYSGAALDLENVLELGLEKLHLIPVPGPTGDRVLIVWAARSGTVLAPALLDPAPGGAPTDRKAWAEGIAVLQSLNARVLLPDPGRPDDALDAGWMGTVRP